MHSVAKISVSPMVVGGKMNKLTTTLELRMAVSWNVTSPLKN